MTVASLATTTHSRPDTRPTPVMMPGAGRLVVVHAVGGQRRQLEERAAGVEQRVDPVARQQLAAVDVPLAAAPAEPPRRTVVEPRAQVVDERALGRGVAARRRRRRRRRATGAGPRPRAPPSCGAGRAATRAGYEYVNRAVQGRSLTRPTGRPAWRRHRGPATQILRQAARLFAERGFRGTSVDDIGAACGISGPALYKHFPTSRRCWPAARRGSASGCSSGGRAVVDAAGDPHDGARRAGRLPHRLRARRARPHPGAGPRPRLARRSSTRGSCAGCSAATSSCGPTCCAGSTPR